MIHKKFLNRPTITQVLRDPWFDCQGNSQPLDVQALKDLSGQRERTDLYRALLTDVAARQNLAQLSELNDTFIKLDSNNDGHITAAELREGLQGMFREEELKRLVAVLGVADGGEVSYDEFLGELLALKIPEENALLQRLFNEVDVDRKGYLGPEELAE